jgi:hypothetical protein
MAQASTSFINPQRPTKREAEEKGKFKTLSVFRFLKPDGTKLAKQGQLLVMEFKRDARRNLFCTPILGITGSRPKQFGSCINTILVDLMMKKTVNL